jgi:hypothetical protein
MRGNKGEVGIAKTVCGEVEVVDVDMREAGSMWQTYL